MSKPWGETAQHKPTKFRVFLKKWATAGDVQSATRDVEVVGVGQLADGQYVDILADADDYKAVLRDLKARRALDEPKHFGDIPGLERGPDPFRPTERPGETYREPRYEDDRRRRRSKGMFNREDVKEVVYSFWTDGVTSVSPGQAKKEIQYRYDLSSAEAEDLYKQAKELAERGKALKRLIKAGCPEGLATKTLAVMKVSKSVYIVDVMTKPSAGGWTPGGTNLRPEKGSWVEHARFDDNDYEGQAKEAADEEARHLQSQGNKARVRTKSQDKAPRGTRGKEPPILINDNIRNCPKCGGEIVYDETNRRNECFECGQPFKEKRKPRKPPFVLYD